MSFHGSYVLCKWLEKTSGRICEIIATSYISNPGFTEYYNCKLW